MRILIICNTPYQIFNAVNMVVNNVAGMDSTTDVLVEKEFSNADQLCANLRELCLFNHVYEAKRKCPRKKNKIKSFYIFALPDKELSNYVFSSTDVLKDKYDKIFIGDGNILGQGIYALNNKAEVVLYDDGTQSYSEKPIESGCDGLRKAILKPLSIGVYRYNIKEIYLNNSGMGRCVGMQLKQLPRFSEENRARSVMKKLFRYDAAGSYLSGNKLVLLEQRLFTMSGFNGLEPLDLLEKMKVDLSGKLVVRSHPGMKKDYIGVTVDRGKNMWELECLENITDEHILIAACSNAQLTPKFLADKEPVLVFLCNLLFDKNSSWLKIFNNNVKDIEAQYRDKDKIYNPKSIDEFRKILLKIGVI